MEIRYLAECTEVIPELAMWFRSEWPDEVGEDVEQVIHRCAQQHKVPVGLVAFRKSRPIGTVQILSASVHSHGHLKPWIAGLYVVPERRHHGVACRLIDAALDTARLLEVETVYVGIQAARDIYENRGWIYLEDGSAGDETVMILTQSLT